MVVALLGGLAVLAVGSLAAVGLWRLLGSGSERTADVVESFELASASSGPSISDADRPGQSEDASLHDPRIRAAQQFIELAAVPNSSGAMKMIDKALFDKRVRGPDGSAAAVLNKVTADKLLSNFGRRSLESTPANGALRHWKVLGKTRFDGQDAVLVRYYSELVPPIKWIKSDELLGDLIPLISFDQYWKAVGKLHWLAPNTVGTLDNTVPQQPNANGLLFPRVGYLLLCFEDEAGEPKLSDLASAVSRVRLSRASGELYLRDWDVRILGRMVTPETVAEPLTVTIYGELPQGMLNEAISFDATADFRHYVDPNAKPPTDLPELPADQQPLRTYRLREIASHVRAGSPKLAEKLAAFRRDFPNDLAADMVVVSLTMVKQTLDVSPNTAPVIIESAEHIYDQLQDPLMPYVQWAVAKSQQDEAEMARHLMKLDSAGFETAALHRDRLERAVAEKDPEEVLAVLNAMGRYWDPNQQSKEPEPIEQVQQRWTYLAERQAREADEVAQSGSSTPGRRFGLGARRFGGIRLRNRPDLGPQRSAASGTAEESRRGDEGPSGSDRQAGRMQARERFSQPTAPSGPQSTVVILIEADRVFDINALASELVAKLGIKNYRVSRRNNQGTINMQYAGPVQAVIDSIDFGTAEIDDGAARQIRVRLNQ